MEFELQAFSTQDRNHMREALRLAVRGRGRVSPNPLVGCVLVRGGRIVGRGWHRSFGGPHAEIEALRAAGKESKGAEVFVTLEPCAHAGKTPPCTEALIAAGVSRVVAATRDPNPRVAGGGLEILARTGVEVAVGLLEEQARILNRGFFCWAQTGHPFVTLKLAMSLDGRVATRSGDSKWITGLKARREAHRLRGLHDAVVVGDGTVRADDPELTVRLVRGVQPARIVLDPKLESSPRSRWLRGDGVRKIVVVSRAASAERLNRFEKAGAEVWTLPADRQGNIRLSAFLGRAVAEGFLTMMVEGGGRLAGAFIASDAVSRLEIFMAPLLLGEDALGWTEGLKVVQVAKGKRLREMCVRTLGQDLHISGDL